MPTIWMPDYPPASANASDDEFNDSSLSGTWTEWDEPGSLTVSENDAGLLLAQTTNATVHYAGIWKAAPSGDWSIWTKVSIRPFKATIWAGLVVGDALNSAPGTSDFAAHVCGTEVSDGTIRIWPSLFDAYNGSGLVIGYAEIGKRMSVYLRVRKSGTTYAFDYSNDGLVWRFLGSSTINYSAPQIGLCIDNRSGETANATFAFFRVVGSALNLTDVVGGQRIDPDAALFQAAWASGANKLIRVGV